MQPTTTLWTSILLLTLSIAAQAAPRIVIEEFRIEPVTLRLGESFTVRARATATGVKLGSFLLRTAESVKKENAIPGFSLYSSGKYYVAEGGSSFLKDNGKLDGDSRTGAFVLRISTKDWKPGLYALAFFASCRPGGGPFVAARHDFAVVVEGDRVRIEDLGGAAGRPAGAVNDFRVEPAEIRPGQPVRVSLVIEGEPASMQLTDPYCLAASETLPGFQYDAAKKKSFRSLTPIRFSFNTKGDPSTIRTTHRHEVPASDRPTDSPHDRSEDEPSQVVQFPREWRSPLRGPALTLDTRDWPPGVHHFVLNLLDPAGRVSDYRNFAVKVIGPNDRLKVTVEESWTFAPGTHFGRFLKLRDGTLLCEDKLSRDGGRTWQSGTGGFGVGGEQLRDGRVLGLEYRCLPVAGKEGWYQAERFLSTDGGRGFARSEAGFHVPDAKAAHGHALHPGPLFMRSIVERNDGSLVALMAGWFKSDTAICPYGRERPYSRSYVCESADGGATWRYLTTLGYDRIGSEGYNEGSMRRLPSGELLAVLRTGSEKDVNCQDNPIMWTTSRDEGRTWSKPERTGVEGAYPSLAVLSDGEETGTGSEQARYGSTRMTPSEVPVPVFSGGLVVMSYGRPGAMLVFSADGGRTWTDPTCIDVTPYSGYTDVVELQPGILLVGYGAQGYLDPRTGEREDQLRLARVTYREKTQRPKPRVQTR